MDDSTREPLIETPAPFDPSEDAGDLSDAPWMDAEAEKLRCAGCGYRVEHEILLLEVRANS